MTVFEKINDTKETMRYGDVIRRKRKLMGMNQTEFGEVVDVCQGTLSKWELGITSPPFDTAEYILKSLGYELIIREKRK